MPLPARVQKMAQEAERLAAAVRAGNQMPPQPAPASAETPATTPAPTPAPAAIQSPAPASADTAALQKQLVDTQEELRKANTRYDTLQRKYDVEVPRAAADLRELKNELKSVKDKLESAEAEAKRRVEAGEVTSLNEQERELMGPMGPTTAKIAKEIVDRAIAEAMKPVNERFDQFQRMSQEAYWMAIEDAVPDWEQINGDQKFMAWLNQVDPVTQRLRMDLLKRAEAALQGNRVVEVFVAFKDGREIGALTQPTPPVDPLAAGLSPPEGAGSQPQVDGGDQNKKIWNAGEITQFYRDKRTGLYRGREAEARSIEQDIFAAQREGRIRA